MNPVLVARLVLVAVGLVVWGYGYRMNLGSVRTVGIGILAVSLVLRFFARPKKTDD